MNAVTVLVSVLMWTVAAGRPLVALSDKTVPMVEPSDKTAGVTIAVLGHIRGDPTDGMTNYLLDELIDDVNRQHADVVILTGDTIYGDVHHRPADAARVVAEYDALDAALERLNATVYRVPGNHEIHDRVTRDIYFDRYGRPPVAVDVGRNRLLLLNSCWVPDDDDTGPPRGVRGWPLGRDQIDFLRTALADTGQYDNAFVFMHHLLWWRTDAPWWRRVHPVLTGGKVRAVFSGEYGPYKYSHMRRDGIDYLQCAIENPPVLDMMRYQESSRLLSQLMDCYLLVRASADGVNVEVRPVGALTSGNYSPKRWAELYDYRPWYARDFDVAMRRYPLAVLAGTGVAGLGVGLIAGWCYRRRALRAERKKA